ncbi:O-fucosyltransferase family protein [Phanerochaete sordida]|uniref:O-fucosyltransferase family protein n=1 Tax=Phanerochaete sordida TaxID=48140 RepID=A0A9P3L881_9APHY|nr:O-fucosyltransferase family protein [Phanerochaete sordida]
MKEQYGHSRTQSGLPLLPYADTTPPSTPFVPSFRTRTPPIPHRRKSLLVLCAFVSVVSLGVLASFAVHSSRSIPVAPVAQAPPAQDVLDSPVNASFPYLHDDDIVALPDTAEYPPWVNGPPTQRFRDNLRNDTQYITSWLSAGWNNDVMTYMNLIYLGIITDRVPVVAMFTPSHIGGDAGVITFGEVFDVQRFRDESGTPLLEWLEVKDPESEEVDELGCWNIWEAVQYYEHFPRGSSIPDWLKLDISYTRAPDWVKQIPGYEHDKCSTFWSLARLAYPEDREPNLGNILPSPQHGVFLDPDEHMLCYDYLYYACAGHMSEYDSSYAPEWRYVGKYMHWTEEIQTIAAQYVNRVFGLPEDGPVPPYISIHVRHGDFSTWCWDAETPEDCFAPLPVIARRVREVQDEILQRKGIYIPMSRVIMTSDEKDEEWWKEVVAQGWVRMDHDALQTEQRYTRWHPVILDAAIQSAGLGFVGTDRSTFSVLSRRRVLDWNDGAVRMVLWGRKGADDH